jgi:biotin/methionine sulfoxide reductase
MNNNSDLRVTPFSTHWGTYFAEVRGGRLTGVRDYADDPDPAVIGPGIVDMVDHPTRIAQPMIRKSYLASGRQADRAGRGREPFVAVPWDEALDIAGAELKRVAETHGNGSIFGGSYGWGSAGRFHHAQSQVHRFLNCIGGYVASTNSYSHAAVDVISPHVVGRLGSLLLDRATSWNSIVENTRLVVMFGGLPVKNAQVTSGGVGRHTMPGALRDAKARGAEFVSISPIRSDVMPEIEAEWLAPRPGTDMAVMLGLAHTLVAEGLNDRGFLARYTVGFERFLPYLTGEADGQPKDAGWAAGISGLDAETIRALARRMASVRTMISVAWSIQRSDHGEMPSWMAIVLAAMLGQIGLPGGGFGIGYGSENGIGNPVRLFRFPALPQGENPVAVKIPVARISDALLHPGEAYDFNGERREYPDLRLVYWSGGNPFHHHQDLNRLVRAFRRPETIIVNDIWWTQMARHADIVFPATTVLEREDIFSGLARRMGVEAAFTEGRNPEDWVQHLWDQTRQRAAEAGFELPGLEELRERETILLPPAEREAVLLEEFRADPAANALTTPSGKIEIFSRRIAGFGYDDNPGHPVWVEPYEWLGGAMAKEYPLHLISNQPRTRLHSQFDPGSVSRASKVKGREPMVMHPDDAAARGIGAGDVVQVFNGRGACLAGVIVSDEVMRGVVQLSTGAWYDPEEPGVAGSLCKHGNPNVLTRDVGTSRIGQGPSAQTVLVEVERFEGTPPPVTAFVPPVIEERG